MLLYHDNIMLDDDVFGFQLAVASIVPRRMNDV